MAYVILGYLLLTVIAPLAGFFVGKYTNATIGYTVGGGISTIAGVLLHKADPPGSAPPAAPTAPKVA